MTSAMAKQKTVSVIPYIYISPVDFNNAAEIPITAAQMSGSQHLLAGLEGFQATIRSAALKILLHFSSVIYVA